MAHIADTATNTVILDAPISFGAYGGPWSAGFSRRKYRMRNWTTQAVGGHDRMFIPMASKAERERVLLYVHDSPFITGETIGWGHENGYSPGPLVYTSTGRMVIVNISFNQWCWSGPGGTGTPDPAACPSGWADLGVSTDTNSTTSQVNAQSAGANDYNIGQATHLQKLTYGVTYGGGAFGPDASRVIYGCPGSHPYKPNKVRTCAFTDTAPFVLNLS